MIVTLLNTKTFHWEMNYSPLSFHLIFNSSYLHFSWHCSSLIVSWLKEHYCLFLNYNTNYHHSHLYHIGIDCFDYCFGHNTFVKVLIFSIIYKYQSKVSTYVFKFSLLCSCFLSIIILVVSTLSVPVVYLIFVLAIIIFEKGWFLFILLSFFLFVILMLFIVSNE